MNEINTFVADLFAKIEAFLADVIAQLRHYLMGVELPGEETEA